MFEQLTLRSVDVRPVLVPLRRPVVSKVGPVRPVADDPDRSRDRGRHRRPELSRAVPEGSPRAIRAGDPRSRGTARRPAVRPLDHYRRAAVAEPGRPGGDVDDRGVGARHGGVGCARQGRRHAARGVSRRFARHGAGLQQQRALADRRRDARRRGGRLVAEGGFKGLKLRLGRERLADDIAAIKAVRARPEPKSS